jgi:serine/threonine protein kinase
MDKYTKGAVLGSGTFAEVFKATNKEVGSNTRMDPGKDIRCNHPPHPHDDQSGKVVAIKKIRIGDSKVSLMLSH